MARARNIKPGFFKNEVLAELSFEQRLLFIGLWTLADREGRLEDRPKRIKAELFAFDSIDVEPMLDRLRVEGFLVRYEAGGVRYIHITNFVKHQDPHYKEKASEIPPPPGFENEVRATNVTRTQRQRILERDGFKCRQCSSEDHLSIDHVVPVSRGGDSSDENLQVLCLKCNTSKSNKLDGEDRARKKPKQGVLPGSVFDIQRQPDVGSKQAPQSPGFSDSLSSDSLIADSSVPNGTGGDAAKPAEEMTKDELWSAGKSLLMAAGMPKGQCGSFVGKLVKDYGDQVVIDAVRTAVVARPADPAEYLKACCLRSAGKRGPKPLRQAETPEETARMLDERDKKAAPQPAEVRARIAELAQQMTGRKAA